MSYLLKLMRKVASEDQTRNTSSLAIPQTAPFPTSDAAASPSTESGQLSSDSQHDNDSSPYKFCRSHCCNFNLPIRKTKLAGETTTGRSNEGADLSLGEMEAANANVTDGDLTSLEADFSHHLSINEETKVNEEKLAEMEQEPSIKLEPVVEPIVYVNEVDLVNTRPPKSSRRRRFRTYVQTMDKTFLIFPANSSTFTLSLLILLHLRQLF